MASMPLPTCAPLNACPVAPCAPDHPPPTHLLTAPTSDIHSASTSSSPSASQHHDHPQEDTSTPAKKRKQDSDALFKYLEEEYLKHRELYCDHVLELFFLEQQGNITDYYNWRKKPPTNGLLACLRNNSSSEEEFDELTRVKTVLDSSQVALELKLLSESFVIPEKSPQVTLPSPSSVNVATSRAGGVKVGSSGFHLGLSNLSTTPRTTSASHFPTSSSSKNAQQQSVTPSSHLISLTSKASAEQHSISYVYESSIGSQEQIVERAKQEAYVMQRIAELRKEGLWSARRLPKVQEPPRAKAHWDYLLEEMTWLATDFEQERKWKKAAAKKCARMVMKYHQDKDMQAEKMRKEELARLKKIASTISKEVKLFWSSVEKLVEFKQQTRLEEKRKKALDLHLSYIVDQTEKYSSWLSEGLSKDVSQKGITSIHDTVESKSTVMHDSDFEPDKSLETDDEETIAKEEKESGAQDYKSEIELLQQESEMPLEQFIQTLPPEIIQDSPTSSKKLSDNNESQPERKSPHDDEFQFFEDENDDEETIEKEEMKQGEQDHEAEIMELENEANLSIEAIYEKYREMQNSDFDEEGESDLTSEETTQSKEDYIESQEEESQSEESEYFTGDENSEPEEIGMEFLINPDLDSEKPKIEVISEDGKVAASSPSKGPTKDISDIAAGAESIQPKGSTLSTATVATKVPFLLKHKLREYQHIGLDWLAAMYEKKLNGILADEMGLGKTIQTIALLAHLACDKYIWGPHLVVVPTSVMLNWEMEFKKWCPAFKILTYYGSPKERKEKRKGWTKPNTFHVCITSYKLVIQDHQSFRRKKWKYLILDEAQHIKNFKSQRWQMLLNFNSTRRLLLTGTPLQNNLMELWSLMHFLMPNVFASHRDFKDWFVNPVTGMIEGNNEYNEVLIRRLHKILRPFLLRRLKLEVEKQLPQKYEHVVFCRLSKRQRFLYEEFMGLTKTKDTLASGNFLSVINVLMQLRKVCNHPNLFETRPIISPFSMEGLTYNVPSLVRTALDYDPFKTVSLDLLHSKLVEYSYNLSAFAHHRIRKFFAPPKLIEEIDSSPETPPRIPRGKIRLQIKTTSSSSSSSTNQTRNPNVQRHSSPKPFGNIQIKPSSAFLSAVTPPNQTTSVPTTTLSASPVATPRFVFLSNSNTMNTSLKPLTGNSGVLTVSEAGPNLGTPTPSNVIKKFTITTPLNNQSSQLGSQKVKIQIGKLVQTPSGQHILVRPVSNTPTISVASTGSSSTPKPFLVAKQPPISQLVSPKSTNNLSAMTDDVFYKDSLDTKKQNDRKGKLSLLAKINNLRCSAAALYAPDLVDVATVTGKYNPQERSFNYGSGYLNCLEYSLGMCKSRLPPSRFLSDAIRTPDNLISDMEDIIKRFVFYVSPVSAPRIRMHSSHPPPWKKQEEDNFEKELHEKLAPTSTFLHPVVSNFMTQFPELRLIQYDCGKLQALDSLLWKLRMGSHRVLIFTQMSRMLDIFEQFLNYHGHTYLRLDGSTKIEQRQALMERFNADKRIFCFILSTRSGGIGVNLTGADTVIFYDSDWNPTMDAQAQDRCHRIGQTRDVHIYRLISEKTVEENILAKAQQKRLLGDVAIEGGNFTTAFFKKDSIRSLFGIDLPINNNTNVSVDNQVNKKIEDNQVESKKLEAQLEQALEKAEEAPDVAAAKTARAEAAAEFAEFDETIPIDEAKEREEKSPQEKEFDLMIQELTPVERYAMQFLESIQEPMQVEQLKQAEEEIEAHKKEWELGHLKSMMEEQERAAAENENDRDDLLAISREEACQIYISYNALEQMPVWAPPTPPQDENDLYVDYTIGFQYESSVMPESQLPPVYVPKEQPHKRPKLDHERRKTSKAPKQDVVNFPRSLFDRPPPALIKLRKDLKMQKLKGVLCGGPDSQHVQRILSNGGSHFTISQPMTLTQQASMSKTPQIILQGLQQDNQLPWGIFEDWSTLQVIQYLQELPLNLLVLTPGHLPNWDFVSDYVNSLSSAYRSPKLCRFHYESTILAREEGKLSHEPLPKKTKKGKNATNAPAVSVPAPPLPQVNKSNQARPMRTSHIYAQDNNSTFSQLSNSRFEIIKQIANKRTPTLKPYFLNPTGKNPKHIALLQESNISYEQPLNPMQVATNRADRIAKEKAKNAQLAQEQQLARQKQQQHILQLKQQQILQQSPTGKPGAILTSPTNIQFAAQFPQVAMNQSKNIALTPNVPISLPKTAFVTGTSPANPQQVANIAKAILSSQTVFQGQNRIQTQSSTGFPAATSVATVLPQATRIAVSTVLTSPTPQFQSVSGKTISFTPAKNNGGNTAKAMTSASFVASFSGSVTTNSQATTNQQVANIAKALSEAAAAFPGNNSTIQQQAGGSSVTTMLPQATRIGSGIVTIPTVQDIVSGNQQQSASQVSPTTTPVLSVATLPPQTQKILAATLTPHNQVTTQIQTSKITPAQLQVYKQQLIRQQQQARNVQAQNITPQIRIGPNVQQGAQQTITQQQNQPQASTTQPQHTLSQQQVQQVKVALSGQGVTSCLVKTSGSGGQITTIPSGQVTTCASQQVATLVKSLTQAFPAGSQSGQQTAHVSQQQGLNPLSAVLPQGTRIFVSSNGGIISIPTVQAIVSGSQSPTTSATVAQTGAGGQVLSVTPIPQNQPKIISATLAPGNQTGTKITQAQLQVYKQQILRQQGGRSGTGQPITQHIRIQQQPPPVSIQLQPVSQASISTTVGASSTTSVTSSSAIVTNVTSTYSTTNTPKPSTTQTH